MEIYPGTYNLSKKEAKRHRPTDELTYVYDQAGDEYNYPKRTVKKNYEEYSELWGAFMELQTVVRWRNKPNKDGEIPRIAIQTDPLKLQREQKIRPIDAKKNDDIAKVEKEKTDKEVRIAVLESQKTDQNLKPIEKNKLQAEIDALKKEITDKDKDWTDRKNKIEGDYSAELSKINDEFRFLFELQSYTAYHAKLWKDMDETITKLSKCAYVQGRNPTDYDQENYKNALYDMIFE